MATRFDGTSLVYTRPKQQPAAEPASDPPPIAAAAQQSLPYDWQFKERLALIRSLELPLAEHGPGKVAALIDFLERILLAACRSEDGLTSHARKSYLAAGLEGRRTVSERTIQTWGLWAEELGLVEVDRRSLRFGGHRSNVWRIRETRLRELCKCPAGGRKAGRSGGEATSSLGEKRLLPFPKRDPEERSTTTTPAPQAPSATADVTWQVVEVELIRCGISETKLREILSRRQRIGESPSGFLSRLAVGQRTIRVPANAEKFRSPVGALVCFLATGNWPAVGIVAPERADAAAAKRRSQAKQKEMESLLTDIVRSRHKQGLDNRAITGELLAAGLPAEFVQEHWGWGT